MARWKDQNRIVEPSPLAPLAGEAGPQPAHSPAGAGRVRGSGIRCRIYETTYLAIVKLNQRVLKGVPVTRRSPLLQAVSY